MKNIAFAFALTFLLAACSSGSSVSETPPDDISGVYTGDFESSNGNSDGTLTLSIIDTAGELTGNLILEFNPNERTCILNSAIEGSRSGFNASITTTAIAFTLTISGDGRTLSGSYVPSASSECSNGSGSGTVTVTR